MEAKRETAALFVAAFAVRLLAAWWKGFSSLRFGDSLAYIGAARRLLSEGSYPSRTDGFFFRPPGYPVFLAISTASHPGWVALDKIWNALLGAAAVVLIAAIARRVFEDRRVVLGAAALAAVHPPFVDFGSEVQSEALYLVLALSAAFLLLVCLDRPSSGLGLLAGGALALASLVRPSALALAPLLATPLFDRRLPTRVRRSLAASAIAGFVVVLAPWAARNAISFGAFLPVNDEAGFTFYQGNSDWNARFYRLRSPGEYARWLADLNDAMRTKWPEEIPGSADVNPGRRSRALLAASARWIRQNPGREARLLREKTAQWLRPGASSLLRGRVVVALTTIYYAALFLAAALGLATAGRKGVAFASVSILVATMAVHVAFLVLLRYRIASWDPILLLYAPAGALRWVPAAP